MEKTQPNSRTLIGLVIGAIVLVAGLLLISNVGDGGGTDTPSVTQTRVAVQPTATPESQASPIPGERRNGEEDPDGDGFVGDLDFCPEVNGAFEGCPDTDGDGIGDSKDACIADGDLGYGIDSTGCPNPPTDDDNDGIFDNDDTCRGQGDAGFGVDSVGCPLPDPNPDTDGDGVPDASDLCPDDNGGGVATIGADGCPIIAIVPDSAPAIVPYRFEGMGGMICTVTIVNVGDGDPATFGEASGLVADENGVIEGNISILLGANDTPEVQIACVPDSAPAIVPYRFEGLGGNICTVTVFNMGDGNPAVLGEASGLVADGDGVIEGNISILLGANDTPEVQIACVPDSAPPIVAILDYQFIVNAGLTCEVVIIDEGGVTVITLPALIGDDGVISGSYSYDPTIVPNPRAEVQCNVIDVPLVGFLPYEFDHPAGATCEVNIIDEGGVTVITIPVTADESGKVSGTYEYDPTIVPNPRAEFSCAMVPPNAPAIMQFEYTGIPDEAVCSVVIVNVGEGKNNAELGRADDLIPVNGVVSGEISILLGAGDVPQAEISCGAVSLPPAIAGIPYYYDGIPADATCQIIIIDEGDVEVIRFDVTQDENGVISGFFEYDPGVVPSPRAELACGLVGTPIAAFAYESSGHPTDAEFCDVVFLDINGQQVAVVADLPDENGVVSGTYEYDPSQISPVTFEVICALAGGSAEITPEVTLEATLEVTPEITPEGTPDAEVTPEGTPDAEVTPEGTPDVELTPEVTPDVSVVITADYTCSQGAYEGINDQVTIMFMASGNYPTTINYRLISGNYASDGNFTFDQNGFAEFQIGLDGNTGLLELSGDGGFSQEIAIDCTPKTIYAVVINKLWYGMPQENGEGLGAPALGSSIGPIENIDNFITATSSLSTVTCSWNGSMQALLCSGTYADGFTPPIPNTGDMALLWVPVGEGYTVSETVPTGWNNAYGLEWWQTCDQEAEVEGYKLCLHTVVNEYARPPIYLVQIHKEFREPYFTNNGGLNAPALGGGYPAVDIDNLITATSSLGRAECDWFENGTLNCLYFAYGDGSGEIPVDHLLVPEGESYTVVEAPIEGWVTGGGVGTFTYEQCVTGNYNTGYGEYYEQFDVSGYCEHSVVNVIPDTETWMVIDIDKYWVPNFAFEGGVRAPAQGGYGNFTPDFDIPGLIVVTSDYGTMTCDWYAAFGGDFECRVNLTTRPFWYQYYDELPVGPGGTYTVVENVPDGWTTISGTGTFSLDTCQNRYDEYEEYIDENGEEQEILVAECEHEIVNMQNETDLDNYYGVDIEKIWNDYEPTATLGGLNSPAQGTSGDPVGPNTSYYPLIQVTSSLGIGQCHWYYWGNGANLECYYEHYDNSPIDPYNFLLVPLGESYTVTEVAIDGYINISGLGTFDNNDCQFFGGVGGGYYYEYDVPVCYHEVVNQQVEIQDYYQVQIEKYWDYGDYEGGLGAPAEGGGFYGPLFDVPNMITVESSIGTAVCSWNYEVYDSWLTCVYSAKDGQTMPDNTSLWVPMGESYTVNEIPVDGWQIGYGTGEFNLDSCQYRNGNTCYHTVVNFTTNPTLFLLFVGKEWFNFDCPEEGCGECDYYDDCYDDCYDCESNNSGLGAPAQGGGGFETPGPDNYISNLITVTSDLGSMTCDWVPSYYDIFYRVTFGYLDCRVTSAAEGYPPFPFGLWIPAGGSYTVTENVPAGYYNVYGTGTFTTEDCEYGGKQPTGEYYGDIYECYHFVGNDAIELTPEPTPEITPTEEITPTVEVTPTEEITPTVEVTPTEEVTATPEVTVTPEVSETPTETTPETPVVPEATPTEEIPTGDCGPYSVDADGFPIISLRSEFCGGDSEGQVVNFAPIETGGEVCLPEALYHSNANGTWDIFRTGSDLAEPENLTNGTDGIISMAPTRSPNGRYVTFVSNADGDWEIYLIDIEGEGKLMQLTNNEYAIDLDPVFSPSGRYIAYESNVDGNWEIRLINLVTGEKTRVTNHPANDINPFWHPDGDKIVFQSDRTGSWQIFDVESIAGESRLRLLSDGLGNDFDPTYSHDGEHIAFRSERNGETGIYVMDADGGGVIRVSPEGMTASTPVWSSDNRYIAYQASKTGETLNDIYVFDTETGETRQITANDGDMATVQDVAPTWLCNSLTLIFASDVSGNNRIYAVPALPISDPPLNLTGLASWTENEFNNRDPQNTPSEENGSRMGALPPSFNP